MTTRRPLRSFVVWTMIIFWRAILSQYDATASQQEELRRLLFTLREQILPPP